MMDHDRLFKELISTFFLEFIELFFPQMRKYLDSQSITFLDKEIFTDVTEGEKYESDLIAQVKFQQQDAYFLVHVEAQATAQADFNRRMFTYFARLEQKFALPVYPIVIFSYDRPQKPAINQYEVKFPDFKVLEFNYQVIQLNRLNWRDFLNQSNPVASALMAKMKIAAPERAKVKAECLRLLVTLKLDPARMNLISGFVDSYLNLNPAEEKEFEQEISIFRQEEQEEIMEITTSWMRKGIEQGIEQGIKQGIEQGQRENLHANIISILEKRFETVPSELSSQINSLEDVTKLQQLLLETISVNSLTEFQSLI